MATASKQKKARGQTQRTRLVSVQRKKNRGIPFQGQGHPVGTYRHDIRSKPKAGPNRCSYIASWTEPVVRFSSWQEGTWAFRVNTVFQSQCCFLDPPNSGGRDKGRFL